MLKKLFAVLSDRTAQAALAEARGENITGARREFLKRTLGAVAVAAVTPALTTTAACGDDDDDDSTGTDGTGDDDDSTNTTGSTQTTTDGGGTTETTGGTTDGTGTETTETSETTGGVELPATAKKFGAAADIQLDTLVKFADAKAIVGRDAGGYYAFTSICTHLACDTSRASGTITADTLKCTCHGSTYDKDGGNTGGPAKKPLANKRVYIVDGDLYVDPKETVATGTRIGG